MEKIGVGFISKKFKMENKDVTKKKTMQTLKFWEAVGLVGKGIFVTKQGRRCIVQVCIFLALVFCFYKSAANLQFLQQDTRVTILYEENKAGYTGAYAAEVHADNDEQEEQLSFTFWGDQGVADITGVDLERTTSCSVLAVCGNTQNLYPDVAALWAGDEDSCLISEGAAQDLFGGSDVEGLCVRYQEKEYTIAGVIAQEQALFVFETSSEEVSGMNHVTVENGQDTYLTEPYRKFQARYGEGLAYDYGFLSGILKWLLGILIFLLLLVPEREIIRRCRELKKLTQSGSQESECKVGASDHILKEPTHKLHKRTSRFAYTMKKYQRCMWMFVGIGMAVVAAWLFIVCFDVSLASFPAVWSDFAAWKELGARWSQEIMTLFCDAKEPFMLPYWGAFFKGLAWSIGCYALYVLQRCGCFS